MKLLAQRHTVSGPTSEFMHVLWPNKLQWRLTVSYTIASVAASVVILFIGGVVAASVVLLTPVWPFIVATDALTLAPQARELLLQSEPSRAAMTTWLLQLKAGLEDPRHQRRSGFSFSFDRDHTQVSLMLADAGGKVLATAPEHSASVGKALQELLSSSEQPLLRSALQGVTDEARLSQRTTDGAALAIVPILNADGKILGVLSARIRRPFVASDFLQNVFSQFPIRLAVVAPCAALFGFGFGFFAARRLTKRIDRLRNAASEWGRGNFGASADERAPDELGQLAHELNRMAEDLQELLNLRQEVAAVNERHRLARELHDTVKQQIFAANMQISAARNSANNPKDAALRLDEAQKLIGYAQQELKAALLELRPGSGQDVLAERLRTYVASWSWQSNIGGVFTADHVDNPPPAIAQALFRIAQESLANVARHSGASRARVELRSESKGSVVLRVTDDGHGFCEAETSGGTGLRNMRERAEALPEGRLRIITKPGEGTKVEVTCAMIDATVRMGQHHVR